MHVVLLGTAAGGGFPQWNCWCPSCRAVRTDPRAARARSQSSAAISADGQRWFLLNASPDVREQLTALRAPQETPAELRFSPVDGIVFTDAELDHTLGLPLLRESRYLPVYATGAVQRILEDDSHLLPVTRAFAEVPVTQLVVGHETGLCTREGRPSGLTVMPFEVPAGPPRFTAAEERGHTVGLIIRDLGTGGRCAFVPGCGGLDDALLSLLGTSHLLLFDGTFWTDDQLIGLGISDRTARQMDHIPVAGPDGSLVRLAGLEGPRRVYTHINNSNPMLLDHGPERAQVVAAGLTVGEDGMRFEI